MAYQSLYRRYRSQKFSEIVGQSHVTTGLRSAVAENRHGHAYLFSGPRGTGKTSTARILAKALNCPDVTDGEPCTVCDSCQAIELGTSFDLHELDAASHNKVDDIRDLISKVHLGSPGRTKVYILDEVHMLSAGAENALLKTLEEPPDHVVFVLATTEPHKVVPTIRSRTQHFEFHLIPAEELAQHVRWVVADAGLDVDDDAIDYVLTQGGGSARDTLSALDLVAAAGGVPAGSDVGVELSKAIGQVDAAAAVAAVQDGLTAGQEPRTIGEASIEVLRGAFLASMGAPLHHLNDRSQATAQELAQQLGAATITRALEAIGQALVEMRQAPDPRVPLEVALLRLCRPAGAAAPAPAPAPAPAETQAAQAPAPTGGQPAGTATDPALIERLATLEQQVADLTARLEAAVADGQAAGGASTGADADAAPPATGPASSARSRLAEVAAKRPPSPRARQGGNAPADSSPATTEAQPEPAAPAPAPATDSPTQTQPPAAQTQPPTGSQAPPADTGGDRPALSAALTLAAVEGAFAGCLEQVSQKTRVRFKGGRLLDVQGTTVVFGVPNDIHRTRCLDLKAEVEQALSGHFGQAVTVDVSVDGNAPTPTMDPAKIEAAPAPAEDADEDIGPIEDLADAADQSANSVERLTKAFPGSKVVEHQNDPNPGGP